MELEYVELKCNENGILFMKQFFLTFLLRTFRENMKQFYYPFEIEIPSRRYNYFIGTCHFVDTNIVNSLYNDEYLT